ncbi:MAG: XdhC family protein [Cognaticolwellia sp.]
MLNHHSHFSLLKLYLHHADKLGWVLATIVNKAGSSYRSPGAFMLVNSLGQSHGLVSGGCLEANIVLHAKKVFDSQQAHYIEYDMREEDGYAAELGVGCKGKIGVLLQYMTPAHQSLLAKLFQRMQHGHASYLQQVFVSDSTSAEVLNALTLCDDDGQFLATTEHSQMLASTDALQQMIKQDKSHQHIVTGQLAYSVNKISAPINLWIFGGGSDAIPLVTMAVQMGWRVTVVDHRSSYARESVFKHASEIIRVHPDDFTRSVEFQRLDGAVLMTHNLHLDAAWLRLLHQDKQAKYIGLLGPLERRSNVEALADIDDRAWLMRHVNGPVGLDLGGELPESIALSILAQCHSILHNRSGLALSGKVINPR